MMPALVVIEDAHWIDDASREVIRNIVRGPAMRPWLICVTRRPQGDDLTHDVQGHHNLRLEPLGLDAARMLAAAAAGDSALAAEALTLLRNAPAATRCSCASWSPPRATLAISRRCRTAWSL